MIKIATDFMRTMNSSPLRIRVWLLILIIFNGLFPLFYLNRIEAQFTLAALLIGMMIGMILFKIQGFTRLLGLMHILWIPLVLYLIIRWNQYPITEWFGIWIRGVVLLNIVSLVLDMTDVVKFIAGDRKPLT